MLQDDKKSKHASIIKMVHNGAILSSEKFVFSCAYDVKCVQITRENRKMAVAFPFAKKVEKLLHP